MTRLLRILQVSTSDEGGGAEKVAYDLHCTYRAKGYPAWLVVGNKRTHDPDVVPVPNNTGSAWQRFCFTTGDFLIPFVGKVQGAGWMRQWLRSIGQLKKLWEIHRGHEDFEFPGSWQIIDLLPSSPDIIHCHNLHGGYFDLRVLPWLSQQAPVILTLHDAWLLSGHCAHSFDCERWKTGCGQCPDLTIYPAIKQDSTAYNWQRKREIYDKSRLYVSTPSNWLMQKVEQSNLIHGIVEARVIPNGVDLSVFHPDDMRSAREALSISQDAIVLLFVANGIRQNIYKDSLTMRAAIAIVAERCGDQKVLFIALGENAPTEQIGTAEILFVPYQKDPIVVASYYQAADIYLHAAKVDTFPTTILEALACGTPVVATSVGGIPEQVRSLHSYAMNNFGDGTEWTLCNKILSEFPSNGVEDATGILVPPEDAATMAGAIVGLIKDTSLRKRLGVNAAKDACQRFDFKRCVHDYLTWYREIYKIHNSKSQP